MLYTIIALLCTFLTVFFLFLFILYQVKPSKGLGIDRIDMRCGSCGRLVYRVYTGRKFLPFAQLRVKCTDCIDAEINIAKDVK